VARFDELAKEYSNNPNVTGFACPDRIQPIEDGDPRNRSMLQRESTCRSVCRCSLNRARLGTSLQFGEIKLDMDISNNIDEEQRRAIFYDLQSLDHLCSAFNWWHDFDNFYNQFKEEVGTPKRLVSYGIGKAVS